MRACVGVYKRAHTFGSSCKNRQENDKIQNNFMNVEQVLLQLHLTATYLFNADIHHGPSGKNLRWDLHCHRRIQRRSWISAPPLRWDGCRGSDRISPSKFIRHDFATCRALHNLPRICQKLPVRNAELVQWIIWCFLTHGLSLSQCLCICNVLSYWATKQ